MEHPSSSSSSSSNTYDATFTYPAYTPDQITALHKISTLCDRFHESNGYIPQTAPFSNPYNPHDTRVPFLRLGTKEGVDISLGRRNWVELNCSQYIVPSQYNDSTYTASVDFFRKRVRDYMNTLEHTFDGEPVLLHEQRFHNLINEWVRYVWHDVPQAHMHLVPGISQPRSPAHAAPNWARRAVPVVFDVPYVPAKMLLQFVIVRCVSLPSVPRDLPSPERWMEGTEIVWPAGLSAEDRYAIRRWVPWSYQGVGRWADPPVTYEQMVRVRNRERTARVALKRRFRMLTRGGGNSGAVPIFS